MKPLAYLFSIFLLFAGCENTSSDTPTEVAAQTVANANGVCDDLSGSWEMVYRTVTTADSIYTQDNTSDGEFVLARGGPYKLENGKYTEIVGYSSVKGNVGTQYEFDCEVVDDSWYHKGPVGDEIVDEIWQRVKGTEEAM